MGDKTLIHKYKKIIGKQKKLQHMLFTDCNITSTDQPTQYLAVLNAGVATLLNEEELLQSCDKYGNVCDIIMLPGKSYCFLVLESIDSSIDVMNNINGTSKLAQGGYPLYLSYVTSVPLTECVEPDNLPEGLHVLYEFINKQEEDLLLSIMDWNGDAPGKSMKHRRVKHYGYEFMYSNNNIDLSNPLQETIPIECSFLWEKLKTEKRFHMDKPPDQLTVNQYLPGQGIPSHVDTHSAFLSPILSLSLGGDVVMEFKHQHTKYNLILPARSLLAMDGAARYEWAHSIAPRTYDLINGRTKPRHQRTSFTFRWIRSDAKCRCSFPAQCDTFARENSEKNANIDDELASLIESQHVHQVYDKIASHFHETRSKIWTSVRCFIEALSLDTVLVDIGCGNGKNLRLREDIMQIGVEYNEALSEVAMYNDDVKSGTPWKGIMQVVRANCLALPFNSSSVDAAISIAVFHHLATKERRNRAINEIVRILKPGGRTLITVWAKDQSRGEKTSYLKQDRKNRKNDTSVNKQTVEDVTEEIKNADGKSLNISLPVHINRSQFQHQDLLVPWKLKNRCEEEGTFMRYYHVFEEGELEDLCKSIPGVEILESFYEQGNWCVILEKNKQMY